MTLTKADVLRIQSTPPSHYDNIADGPASTVARAWVSMKNEQPQWIVVKSAPIVRKFSREPHDIHKELRLVTSLSHRNIISVLGSFEDEENQTLKIYMPYISISLAELLASPYFSPHPFPPLPTPDENASRQYEMQFNTVARSIICQLLCAVAYLHDQSRLIAHRDIKPENILLTKDGCVKLIDFGVAWKEKEPGYSKQLDLWPEYRGKLYFEVCTGAYRAPELLFGSRTYDHIAVDLWSIGATLAEFFTPLRLSSDDTDDGDDDDTEGDYRQVETNPIQPFVVPRYLRIGYPGAQWQRDTLFNGDRGEIGLAWSIFKIYGTPTLDNWPEFDDFPGAKSVVFNVVPAVPVEPLLPNLPPSTRTTHQQSPLNGSASSVTTPRAYRHPALDPQRKPTPFDLLSRFLVYPSGSRQRAVEALQHPWFAADGVILLPRGYEYDFGNGSIGDDIGNGVSSVNGNGISSYGDPGMVNGAGAGVGVGTNGNSRMPLPATSSFGSHLKKISVYEWKGKPLGDWLHSMLLSIPGSANSQHS